MNKNTSDFNLNGTGLVLLVWNKKILFLVVGIVAMLSSIIVGFLLTPYYKSSAILFPSVSTQASKELFVPSSRQKGLTVFGDDEEVEQLLQVLSSETLRRVVIEKENLNAHYNISPDEKYAQYKVNKAFSNSVSFSPTQYRSVRIDVVDYDPKKAARIANTTVRVADSLMRSSKQEVAKKALEVMRVHYQLALEETKRIEDSLASVMARGVLDLPMQTRELYRTYSEAIARGDQGASRRLESQLSLLAASGAPFTRYYYEIEDNAEHLRVLKESVYILEAEAMGGIPFQYVIDWATPADRKDSPKVMMLSIVSTLSALFFTLVLLVIFQFFEQKIKPQQSED